MSGEETFLVFCALWLAFFLGHRFFDFLNLLARRGKQSEKLRLDELRLDELQAQIERLAKERDDYRSSSDQYCNRLDELLRSQPADVVEYFEKKWAAESSGVVQS